MEPFIGQIIMFGGNFAPRGWAFCDGQLLPISQYQALFSLLGTTYGGDGRTTFGLPDLRGRVPMHAGMGPGLSNRQLGQHIGSENSSINSVNLPSQKFNIKILNSIGNQTNIDNTTKSLAISGTAGRVPDLTANGFSTENPNSIIPNVISTNGGGQPIPTLPPVQVVNYIIALQGIFPSRN